jgi:hypothetical protein
MYRLNDLSGTLDDIGKMTGSILEMSKSITTLTDSANQKIEEIYAFIESNQSVFILAGSILSIYFLTGIMSNIKNVR